MTAIQTLDDVAAVALTARRERTKCGQGEMIWHVWGEGAPVVLLHGGSGSWTHWVRNLAALQRSGHCVFVPDMPGCGDSDAPPNGQNAEVLVPWIEMGVASLLGSEHCDLVGFSFGGLAAGLFAACYPDRVQRLVLVGAPALSEEPLPSLDLRPWHLLPKGPARDAVHRHNLLALMLAQDLSADELAVALHAHNVERDRLRQRRLIPPDLLLRTLPRIRCPLTGIWGAEDVLYRERRHTIERALARAPLLRSIAFILGAGHWVQYERPNAFDAELESALA